MHFYNAQANQNLLDTKIHTREDLERQVPNLDIMGEVPFVEDITSITDSRGIFAAENIVVVIYNKLKAVLEPHLALDVTLYETPRNFVSYSGS